MRKILISVLAIFVVKFGIAQVVPVGTPYPVNQNLGRTASTLVSTNNIRFDQGMILGHFTDTTVANALPYLKNYPYTIISVDTNIVYMRNWNATKWMYMPVEGQVVNGDTIHYLIRVNRRPGSDSVFGKYYNGVTTFESFQFIDSSGGGTSGWSLTGNSGTSPGTNFIGTTDGQGLMFKVSNIQSGFIDLLLSNTSFGFRSLTNDVGGDNTAFGFNSLRANTDGFRNTAVGNAALEGNTVGQENVAVGHQAMALGQEGTFNTAIGPYSLYNNTTGYSNAGLGKNSGLANTTGFQNAFVGAGAGEANTTGQENTMVGYDAGLNNTTGIRNVHVGWNAKSGTNGSNNVMIGYRTGASLTAGNTTNVFIGSQSGDNVSQKVDVTNSVAIGQGTFTTANNQMVFGNSSNNELIATALARINLNGSTGSLDINNTNQWGKLGYGNSNLTLKTDSMGLTVANQLRIYVGDSKFWVNPFNQDNDFIVEGATDTALIVGDAGTNRVGIGIINPSTKLHVNGSVRIVDGTQQNGYVFTSDANGVGSWQAPAGGGVALSAITAATGSNSINNANNPQVWSWNTFDGDGDHGLQLAANTTASVGPQGLLGVNVQGANASSTITTAAATFQNIHTGTGSTNIGIDLSVSGGATANYGIRSNATSFFTHDGFWLSGTNGGFFRSSGATGQTEIGMASGSGASTIYTTTDIYGQTGGSARWRTVAAGTYFGNSVASATSQLQSEGSFAAAITTTSSNITLDATHHSVILTSGTPTITLPAASGCSGRIYNIVNQTAGALTISSYIDYTSGAATIIPSHSGLKVQSNGTSWYQIGM